MKDLGEAIKAIFDKVGLFLDVFDLSFFISGATAVAAIAFGCNQFGWWPKTVPPNWIFVTIIVIATYVVGMICFSIGRWVRRRLFERAREQFRIEQFTALLRLHGLEELEPIKSYLSRDDEDLKLPICKPVWALYTRIWAGFRHNPELASSLLLLNRYWVMAATYDGLSIAMLIWSLVLAMVSCPEVSTFAQFSTAPLQILWPCFRTLLLLAGGVICAWFCAYEAGRYTIHQLGELAATLAAAQKQPSKRSD